MKSRLAEQARQERLEQEKRMTPEERLQAFMHHSRLVSGLYRQGREAPDSRVARGKSGAG